MRTPIIVQKWVTTPDDGGQSRLGGQAGEWIYYYQFFGKVEWSKGNERVVADRVQTYDYAYIVARWDERLDSSMRLIISGTDPLPCNIRSTTNVEEKNHLMEVYAERNVGT
jgi:head-tail adaptor